MRTSMREGGGHRGRNKDIEGGRDEDIDVGETRTSRERWPGIAGGREGRWIREF